MNIFQGVADLLHGPVLESGGYLAAPNLIRAGTADTLGGLSRLLSPMVLGGLAATLLAGKEGAANMIKGALLAGGGAYLWETLKNRVYDANADHSRYVGPSAPLDQQAERLVRALVFAARSDGHIDEREKAAIREQLSRLDLAGRERELVDSAMRAPLDPALVAEGVRDAGEALRLYTLSCAVIDIDRFMEKSYLDALAEALHIPADVKEEVESKLKP